ncbi:MAG: SusE domain-containing protein [Bacteroidales bacterium]|nr:SusE domain-containing protein [Bacteroidales bacterium]
MKRYIWMMAAAVFGLTACQKELEEVRLVDPSQVVAPVLHELPQEIVITADNMSETFSFEWDAADFGQPVQYAYTIFGSTDGGNTLVKLYSNISGRSQSVNYEAFNQVVTTAADKGGLGLVAGEATEVVFMVGATVGSNYQTFYSNPRTVSISPTEAERVYEMVWLPGSANGWDHGKAQHLFGYAEDGNTFVGVTDFGENFASNEFKLTGAAGWSDDTGNWGMADPSAAAESASITLKNGSNDNIIVYRAHRYYHFTFTKNDLVLKMDKGFDKVGVIGLNGDWNNDIVMTLSNSKQLFYADIDVPGDSEFKFRVDGAWDTNWGGDMGGLTPGGGNIKVAAGQYRVYLNLNDWNNPTAKLDASMYGQPEESEPEPQPQPAFDGWTIVGTFNGWAEEGVHMTESDGIWTGYFTYAKGEDGADDGFKLRKGDEWLGGTLVNLGEPFATGGDNIKVAPGFYKVVYDSKASTITVSEGNVWSLIGVGGDWNNDIDMTETDGKWVSPATKINGEFKLRYNHGWDVNRGGTFETVGKAFEAVPGAGNIVVPEGEYIVTYDPQAETITVDGAKPQNMWSLIGVGGDWNNDIYMTQLPSGLWISNMQAFSGEFKLRYDNDWAVNRGGTFAKAGEPFAAIQDAGNISVPDGKWQIVYNPALETITVKNCNDAWSVIGEFDGSNWDKDLYLVNTSGDLWESETFRLDGGIKLRFNGSWDVNRGGTFEAEDKAFAVAHDGANISVGDLKGNYFKLVYDAKAETVTLTRAWCLIGEVAGTSWSQDFAMTETSAGVWEGAAVIDGGFKIRKSGTWDVNRGAPGDVEPFIMAEGQSITATPGGKNLGVAEKGKKYKVVYKATEESLVVNAL